MDNFLFVIHGYSEIIFLSMIIIDTDNFVLLL